MKKPAVSIQGYPGSYHDIARSCYFDNGHELLCRDDFKQIFQDVSTGTADYGVVAAENSLYGSIHEIYDLLLKYRHWISGEIYLRIEHCLIGLKGAAINRVQGVHSHPIALAQCEEYLDKKLPSAERFEHHDTAASVAGIAERQDEFRAAIGSKEAAALHGLAVLDAGIETNRQNYTRFIVLEKNRAAKPDCNKSSIILYAGHRPGSLYRALGVFAGADINLTKLESRPIIGKAWHYMFYIDFEAGLQESRTAKVLEELKSMGGDIIELGTYSKGTIMNQPPRTKKI